VGDDALCPHNCIDSWRELHPDFEIRLWGNADWKERPWRTRHHMDAIAATGQLCGVADLMRWEILMDEGGMVLDADSICLSRIPDWMFECTAFASWENELARPGLLTNGFFAAHPGDPLVANLLETFVNTDNLATRYIWYKLKHKKLASWRTTGPQALTEAYRAMKYSALTVLPSHFFTPKHYSGLRYDGCGPVICQQLFASTGSSHYKEFLKLSVKDIRECAMQELYDDEKHY
jgi:mannosyltransferase OCH1-like enzyme